MKEQGEKMTKNKEESLSEKNDCKRIEENTKSSRQKYIQNQQRLRQILDLVPHMIFLKDYDGKILMANKACADFYNTDTKKLVYSNISELHSDKNELERILLEDRKVIDSEEKIELDDVILTDSQGNKKIYKTTKIPFTDPLTKETGSLGISIDITKRKLAEQLRERDKNMLEQAQKISKLGSWELNMESKQIYCSTEIYRILEVEDNYKPSTVNWFMNYIPNEEKRAIFKAFLKGYRTGSRCEHVFPIVTANGNKKIVHAQSQVYKNKNGDIINIIGTWLDITERIRVEQMLKVAKAKAEESDNLKSAFLANMSHEIRTPMNAILGFANLLKIPDISENEKLEYLDHIIQSGDNLLNLINDIIDISKIEAEQLKVEKIPVNINELLDQLYNRYEELITISYAGEIELFLEKAIPGSGLSIETDPYRLQQVISNLLNNAIKFVKDGKIEFGYRVENDFLKFFVKDNGIGITIDKQDLIFKRFGKLEDPGKINFSGTGLGLSISKSLIALLGGNLWLNTEYKSGAEFLFTIPLKESKLDNPYPNATVAHKSVAELELTNKVILIAEDEILNYKLLETLIKRTGAEVLWAKNGLQAVEIIVQRDDIDLIFMDIKMPKMNGYEATRKIKELKPEMPVIAQTAFAFANEKVSILESGCDYYLKKPIQKDEIYKVLNEYLNK